MTKLYSTDGGSYIQNGGAQYSAPLLSRGGSPALLEFHVSMHRYLALANLSDAVGRLYGGLVLTGGNDLRPDHRRQANQLFGALYEHTCRTHELIATYLGFVMFRARQQEEADTARKNLTPPYAALLRSAEGAFGDIDNPRFTHNLVPAIMACAIAALSPPFPDDIATFDFLPECIKFIGHNSPDRRFDNFLLQIVPPWKPGSVLADLETLDTEDVQPAMYAALRALCPETKFSTYGERPSQFREWAAALVKDSKKYPYGFMAAFEVSPHPAETAVERFSVPVKIEGVTAEDPCDLSLRSTGYAKGSPAELATVARACVEQGVTLFCHVFAFREQNHAQVFCFALDPSGHQASIPISIALPIDELVMIMSSVVPSRLVMKIDERWGADAAGLLESTGHAVFRLLHDTSPANMNRLVRSAANKQDISIAIYQLKGDPGFAICAYLANDKYALLAPATELGVESLYKELHELEAVTVLRAADPIPGWLKIDLETLMKAMSTCYVQVLGKFDGSMKNPHLLKGIYK